MLFGGESYADSWLGNIELLLALVILFAVCGWPVWLVLLAIGRRWQDVGVAALNIVFSLVLLVLAVDIDSLTLIEWT